MLVVEIPASHAALIATVDYRFIEGESGDYETPATDDTAQIDGMTVHSINARNGDQWDRIGREDWFAVADRIAARSIDINEVTEMAVAHAQADREFWLESAKMSTRGMF